MTMRGHISLVLLFISAIIFPPRLASQLVQVGPPDSEYCEKVERLIPNLRVNEMAHIFGSVIDGSGEPFKDSKIELRVYISAKQQALLKTIMTDENGKFDLGKVEPGKYRLLASPTRVFEQPQELTCDAEACKLDLTLRANGTDLPASVCPIR
jgi:hypothetical protein